MLTNIIPDFRQSLYLAKYSKATRMFANSEQSRNDCWPVYEKLSQHLLATSVHGCTASNAKVCVTITGRDKAFGATVASSLQKKGDLGRPGERSPLLALISCLWRVRHIDPRHIAYVDRVLVVVEYHLIGSARYESFLFSSTRAAGP